MYSTFTTLLANSADDKLMVFFLFFSRKNYLIFHASCMKCQILFSGKNKKNTSICCLLRVNKKKKKKKKKKKNRCFISVH